jgi:hypothetical protein
MLILKFNETNSNGQQYARTVQFNVETQKELDEVLEVVEKGCGVHPKYSDDEDEVCPKDFNGAGGFYSEFVSAINEDGQDVKHMFKGWYC